jgi:spore maturation protein CgeB
MKPLRIAFFGSSLVSAYWNGAATYYRGIIRALSDRGHDVTFYEPDAYERQRHRDIADPPWATVRVYPAEEAAVLQMLEQAREADLVVKASGIGVFDVLLEEAILDLRSPTRLVAFWDVDAPATLDRLDGDPDDPFRLCIPRYDLVLTYGGGAPVVARYASFGARRCIPIYNGFDPATHHPVAPDARFRSDVSFLGNRLPDRESRVDALFVEAARMLPERRFLLGGSGWHDKDLPANVRDVGHVYTRDHNAWNCSADIVLNISRDSMFESGFSPATRFFEAAGVGACLVTDDWEGVEAFLEPGRQVLAVRDAADIAHVLKSTTPEQRRAIGRAARRRVLSEHTYARRVRSLEAVLEGRTAVYQEAS